MLPNDLRWIVPAPRSGDEVIEAHQVTYEFYQELRYRQELQQYSQWYRETAQRHQQELQKMRGDINLFGWFCRLRGSRS